MLRKLPRKTNPSNSLASLFSGLASVDTVPNMGLIAGLPPSVPAVDVTAANALLGDFVYVYPRRCSAKADEVMVELPNGKQELLSVPNFCDAFPQALTKHDINPYTMSAYAAYENGFWLPPLPDIVAVEEACDHYTYSRITPCRHTCVLDNGSRVLLPQSVIREAVIAKHIEARLKPTLWSHLFTQIYTQAE